MSGPAPGSLPDIVIPVHDAFDYTRECLAAVARTAPNARVVVVDDASTDPRVRPLLEEWCAQGERRELVPLARNVGFVAAAVDGSVLEFAIGAREPLRVVKAHEDVASGARFVGDGSAARLMSVGFDGRLKLWNAPATAASISCVPGAMRWAMRRSRSTRSNRAIRSRS